MIERITYRGWNNAYKLSNGTVQVIVLADVGPRIICYAFENSENIFHEVASDAGITAAPDFRLYGGHRLWVSPEVDRTYFPDNRPVSFEHHSGCASFTAPIEDFSPGTRLQKKLEVTLDGAGSGVTITHRVTNCDHRPTKLAPWAPTMMRPGGRAVLPLPPRAAMDKDHFLSVGPLALWSFTDLADPRWIFGTEYIQLKQQPPAKFRFQEQMTGLLNPAGWGAYFCSGTLFTKSASLVPGASYPDFGCNFEVFTNFDFLELETLGPLVELRPGETATHIEKWFLFQGVPAGEDDSWIRSTIVPLLNQVVAAP
jgi:hypothetical protein